MPQNFRVLRPSRQRLQDGDVFVMGLPDGIPNAHHVAAVAQLEAVNAQLLDFLAT